MAQTTRRVYFTKTVVYKFALDIPNSANLSNSDALTYATGTGGPLNSNADIGELLSGSDWTNGSVTVTSNWAVTTSPPPANVEEYVMWTPSYAYSLNEHVVPTDPTDAITSGGTALLFKVTTAGTTGSSEPTWNATVSGTTSSGTVTFTAVSKF